MDRGTSLYLDTVRFTAALAVFVSHFVLLRFDGGLLWQLQPYGSEAVDVFFVLSGFLIAYTADQRDRSAANFAVNRAARIYSVALPAVLATMALDEVGRTVNPAAYADLPQYVSGQELRQTLLGLAFLNQNWTLATPVGTNVPYWSLGNEVWYYTIFGIAFYSYCVTEPTLYVRDDRTGCRVGANRQAAVRGVSGRDHSGAGPCQPR